MGIIARFKPSDVSAMINQRMQRIDTVLLQRLKKIGEECVNKARITGRYVDQTGNLRNSIGYVIVKDGNILKENFKATAKVTGANGKAGKGSKGGVGVGREFARELAMRYSNGYALIVVAGMNYAAAVESRGKDVLTSAEQLASEEVPKMMETLKAKINLMR
jgi:hypothetical protein